MPIAVPTSSRGRFTFSTPLFVASLICLCLDEAYAIRGLWFRVHPAMHTVRGFDLPFLVWTPALGAFILIQSICRLARRGEISASLAANLNTGVGVLLLMAYLIMTRLAEIAFR